MPSSGYPSVQLVPMPEDTNDRVECIRYSEKVTRLVERAKLAMKHGLFVEWLESFVGAWEETKDSDIASFAGLVEWDM